VAGVAADRVGGKEAVEAVSEGIADLVVATSPDEELAVALRALAAERRIPCFSCLDTVHALLEAAWEEPLQVRRLEEWRQGAPDRSPYRVAAALGGGPA
jgi:hypothetical protein